jgi:predicted kinase
MEDNHLQNLPESTLPAFLMLIGIPGSGKSTWLAQQEKSVQDGETFILLQDRSFFVISPDTLRKQMTFISDQTQNVEVWQEAKNMTVSRLKREVSVILDATNVNTTYRRRFISGLPPCKLIVKTFQITPEEAFERVKNDLIAGKDRADVPEELIYRMYGEFLYTVKVLSSEGFESL